MKLKPLKRAKLNAVRSIGLVALSLYTSWAVAQGVPPWDDIEGQMAAEAKAKYNSHQEELKHLIPVVNEDCDKKFPRLNLALSDSWIDDNGSYGIKSETMFKVVSYDQKFMSQFDLARLYNKMHDDTDVGALVGALDDVARKGGVDPNKPLFPFNTYNSGVKTNNPTNYEDDLRACLTSANSTNAGSPNSAQKEMVRTRIADIFAALNSTNANKRQLLGLGVTRPADDYKEAEAGARF